MMIPLYMRGYEVVTRNELFARVTFFDGVGKTTLNY